MAEQKTPSRGSIPERVLGRTGERVSAIGVGGWHLAVPSVSEPLAIRIVREALDKVSAAETSAKANQGKLRPAELDGVMQAEQQQQQIRARVGTPEEGLRADVERVRRSLRDNKLPRSGTHDRMEAVARELDRLARDHLGQIEPQLTTARKEQESASGRPARPG